MTITVDSWGNFKNIVAEKSLQVQYVELLRHYIVFAIDNGVSFVYELLKADVPTSEQSDFEDNYQPSANAQFTQKVEPPRFMPRLAQETSTITLSGTDTSLLSISGNGQVDFMSFRFSNNGVEVAVFVDGVEAYRTTLDDLKSEHRMDDGREIGDYISVEDGGKIFREAFPQPIDFSSSFELKAQKTGSKASMLAGLIRYRLAV